MEEIKDLAIKINADEFAPLYKQYPGQTGPQGAYLQLDENGIVTASYNAEIGNGVPESVWHGRTMRWAVSPYLHGSELAALVEECRPHLEQVHQSHSVKLDGSNNHVGSLTEAGRLAVEQVQDLCDRAQGSLALDEDTGEVYLPE